LLRENLTMVISTQNLNKILISLVSIITLMILMEPAFALNVERIGKGVSGDTRKKMKILGEIVYYAGIFFSVLGATIFAFRNNYWLTKRYDVSKNSGPIMLVIGLILIATQVF